MRERECPRHEIGDSDGDSEAQGVAEGLRRQRQVGAQGRQSLFQPHRETPARRDSGSFQGKGEVLDGGRVPSRQGRRGPHGAADLARQSLRPVDRVAHVAAASPSRFIPLAGLPRRRAVPQPGQRRFELVTRGNEAARNGVAAHRGGNLVQSLPSGPQQAVQFGPDFLVPGPLASARQGDELEADPVCLACHHLAGETLVAAEGLGVANERLERGHGVGGQERQLLAGDATTELC
ncbi:MAG TPA: hypothetical protein VKU88_01590 [Acidimicrobiales bacterium]|nr:hypothetical protein [Acidimicrobiales bacterium]